MTDLGPDAPTLCTGWTTRDLAAHIIVRERRPDASPGIMLRPLRGRLERVQRATAARPFPELVATVRQPPRWLLPALDSAMNTVEFFVHHEDVRRAQPGWEPRALPPAAEGALWRPARTLAKLRLRRIPAAVVLHSRGYGEVRVGRGGPELRVEGAPGELIMFLSGRQGSARVELTGPDDMVERLRTARLGL